MASNVIVVDSSFRRATVKVNPQTQLTDVVKQACEKLKLRPELYTLKYNKKQIDLSLTYRLAGLPSGAQLELVQSSRSPAVVNIALQLPQTENNVRVTEKFPSSTSLWQILRRFETGVTGPQPWGPNPFNLTQRGIAQTNESGSGPGRLFYEMPTVQVMNRELATFVDLQKTLAQLGITSGSALLRLSFKNSGRPLEEAMAEITEYFKDSEHLETSTETKAADIATAEASKSELEPVKAADSAPTADEPKSEPSEAMEDVLPTTTDQTTTSIIEAPISTSQSAKPSEGVTEASTTTTDTSTSSKRNIAVFHAPKSTTPLAATVPHNENDYLPTIDHAKLHQSRLTSLGKNVRLPSDAEIAATQKAKAEKLSSVEKITVRIRMPDQTMVQDVFGRQETAADVWGFAKLVLRHPEEEFSLRYLDAKGRHVPLQSDSTKKLIEGLGWTGDTMLYMTWGENVKAEVKKESALNSQFQEKAEELKVSLPKAEEPEEKKTSGFSLGGMIGKGKGKDMSADEKEDKMKKFLRFGKK